ncbi:putative trimethyllysine dioxygenase TmlH [Aspergillus melleus]|uniref:putative trimethyllysine dioxygenase TmlH n=1 Tax=Aspergillus melleus TaxID=138277 RepID=UPI001E8CB1B8|nr:uncharacterized protein LDX57_000577 [Aspergillus melleus]KAH8422822.1 hypothetical protein LDX57_000577 [Aspergillus melleus]
MSRIPISGAFASIKNAGTLPSSLAASRRSSSIIPGAICQNPRLRLSSHRLPAVIWTRANSSIPERPSRETPMVAKNALEPFVDFDTEEHKDQYVSLRKAPDGPIGLYGKFWLRENCQCSKCIHPDTRQRIVDTFSIPKNIRTGKVEYVEDGVELQWSDGHRGFYPFSWLGFHANGKKKPMEPHMMAIRFHKHHDPSSPFPPAVSYTNVMSDDQALWRWLEAIQVYGFCFVQGVPVDPESTKSLLERIAFIRQTHYGGFWDFTSDLTFKDTAYTTEALGAHTDNTYFTDPARLQLFHLLSHTDGDGGASLLVDGFHAAKLLFVKNREYFHTLAEVPQPFHASGNEDISIQPAAQAPVFGLHPQHQRLFQIRWNNYDRAAKTDWNMAEQIKWYEAARAFNDIIHRQQLQLWTQLEPGTALIFDNWRMLHGRSEFTGKRRMCGGYINNDDFLSKYRLLEFGRQKVLDNLGNNTPLSYNPNFRY